MSRNMAYRVVKFPKRRYARSHEASAYNIFVREMAMQESYVKWLCKRVELV